MARRLMPALSILLSGSLFAVSPAQEESPPDRMVKIDKVDFLESRYSEKTKGATLVEGESLAIRANVSGLMEKEGNLNCVLDISLEDGEGTVKRHKESVSGGDFKNSLGRPYATFFIEINDMSGTPGKYRLILKARDRHSGHSDVWGTDLVFEQAPFGIYNPRFLMTSKQEEKKQELSRLLPLGGQVDVGCRLLGLTSEGPRIHFAFQVEIYDAGTNEKLYTTEGKPLEGLEYKGRGPEDGVISASHTLTLTRSGRFYVRLIVEDKLSGKKAQRDVRFRVFSPEEFNKEY